MVEEVLRETRENEEEIEAVNTFEVDTNREVEDKLSRSLVGERSSIISTEVVIN